MKQMVLLLSFIIFTSNLVYGATIYVDGQLSSDCTNGNYSIANRNCSGSNGNGYSTIATAISAASAGDTVSIRTGTYNEHGIAVGFTGPSMTTIQAHAGESVTIHNTTVHQATFELTPTANHITFQGLKFTSHRYLLIREWVKHSGNIGKKVFTDRPTGSAGYITDVLFNRYEANSEKQSSIEAVDSKYDWYYDKDNTILYAYSPSGVPDSDYTDPGIAEGNEYKGIAIGNTSSGVGYIVVDNCEISNFAHCGLKGGYKWWVKNCYIHDIGTTSRDHGIYLYGEHSTNNEAIIEHNFFENIKGSAFQIYHGGYTPRYYIVRYNLVKNAGRSGVQLQGAYNQIYNNSFYGVNIGIMFRGTASHDNFVKNNVFDGNYWCDVQIDYLGSQYQFPTNNTVEYNFYGSTGGVHGYCNGCTDRSAIGGDDYSSFIGPTNIISSNNPFMSGSPSEWTDFRLDKGSGCIDTGDNLGSSYDDALDPNDTAWPPSTLDQATYGSGWEIGAFVFRGFGSKPAPVKWKDPPFEKVP